ncbi:phosphatase Slingshot 2 -like protein [Brachionus plicatilis]|uniref:protein-serine/threonine phosphatase n=1 Tax=Brachionus plicatilis TaxID=10195 RepID=A0A3M7T1A9_BRAPC|nr:phosphatase Slingshot 2 -like protein [Brachionus plicatilis]
MSLVTVQRSPETSKAKDDLALAKKKLTNPCSSAQTLSKARPIKLESKNELKNKSMSSISTFTFHLKTPNETKRCSVHIDEFPFNFNDLKALYTRASAQNFSRTSNSSTMPMKKSLKNFKNSPFQNRLSLNLKTKSDYFDSCDMAKAAKTESNLICRHLTEKYFVVKDAALILPRRSTKFSSSQNISTESDNSSPSSPATGDILIHLQSMISLIRPCDTIILAVKLSSYVQEKNRYLVIVETSNKNGEVNEERVIIGLDLIPQDSAETKSFSCSVGLVLPIYANCEISLDGDGGFKFKSHHTTHIFKPVSIQAMWSAYQYLHRAFESARKSKYYPLSSSSSSSSASSPSFNTNSAEFMFSLIEQDQDHDMIKYYSFLINKNRVEQQSINEWYQKEERSAQREDFTTPYFDSLLLCKEQEEIGLKIKEKLREIMMSSKDDYGSMSSIYIRELLERELQLKLDDFKRFIDATIFQFYNQLVECATKILDYLYLGTEWNASNYDSLVNDRVTHILNVSSEVDNFFPDAFKYLNIRVLDIDETDLLKEFDRTFKFIQEAKDQNTACFVHCKMGVSRSASVVIAYLMKEQDYTFEQALSFTKQKRPCVNPNEGFRTQLRTYESILNAHKSKYNLFKPTLQVLSASLVSDEQKTDIFEAFPQQGVSVKEAVNKIKSMSSLDQLNSSSTVHAPVSPCKILDSGSPPSACSKLFTLSPSEFQESKLATEETKIMEDTPQIEKNKNHQVVMRNVQTCPGRMKTESFVKRLAKEINTDYLDTYEVHFSISNENLEKSHVPIGTVKRQVESINITSRPIEYDLVRHSTFEFEKLDQRTDQQPQQTTSPDSKRFKCEFLRLIKSEFNKVSCEDNIGALNRLSEFNRSKKLFEKLELEKEDKLKKDTLKNTSRHSKMNATLS